MSLASYLDYLLENEQSLEKKIYLAKKLYDNLNPKTKNEKDQKKMLGRLLTLWNYSLGNTYVLITREM